LLTDSAWHWGFPAAGGGDDARAFQRFWENAIKWLVRDPALTLLRVELDRVEYRRGQQVSVRVRALHADYTPAAGVAVSLELGAVEVGPGARAVRADSVITGKTGEAHLELPGLGAGAYRLVARGTVDGRALVEEQTFVIRPEGRELEDVVARDDVLREIAAASGGEFRLASLGGPRIKEPRQIRVGKLRTIEVWSHPALLALALGLLGVEWALRRRAGHG
jgi:hypothetical protein